MIFTDPDLDAMQWHIDSLNFQISEHQSETERNLDQCKRFDSQTRKMGMKPAKFVRIENAYSIIDPDQE